MVSMELFRSRVFGGGTTVMMLWAFGILGIYFFTSIYLQTILGFSPTKAGLSFVPMAICMAIFASLAPQVTPRLGAHRTVALGMAAMAAGLYLFARLGGSATFGSLMPGFLLFGAGAGLMNVPLTNVILHSMPPERSGVASALLNASREVAGLLGITVIGAVLRSREGAALHQGAPAGSAFLTGYHDGLLVTVALLAFGTLVGYLALRKAENDHAAPDLEATLAAELAPPDDASSLDTAPALTPLPGRHARHR
jgi:predicted MFS family arabinose efflux permease